MTVRYRRSPYCLLRWEGATLLARSAASAREFRGAERYFPVLDRLTDWTTPVELAAALGLAGADAAERALERLVAMELVERESPNGSAGGDGRPDWNLVDLALQRQTGRGGYDPSRPRHDRPPPAFKAPPPGPAFDLPVVGLDDSCSLRAALETRRSRRRYADRPVPLEQLGRFLFSAARVVRNFHDPVLGELTLRPSPSGGARHPLEIYPVCTDVAGLEPGAYYYHPGAHRLHLVKTADDGQAGLVRQVRAATGDAVNRDPPVILVVTAVFQRTMWKYDGIGLAIVLKDVGALYQTMYLVATGLGLAACGIGGGPEAETARWLGLDPMVESQVGAFLLGVPA